MKIIFLTSLIAITYCFAVNIEENNTNIDRETIEEDSGYLTNSQRELQLAERGFLPIRKKHSITGQKLPPIPKKKPEQITIDEISKNQYENLEITKEKIYNDIIFHTEERKKDITFSLVRQDIIVFKRKIYTVLYRNIGLIRRISNVNLILEDIDSTKLRVSESFVNKYNHKLHKNLEREEVNIRLVKSSNIHYYSDLFTAEEIEKLITIEDNRDGTTNINIILVLEVLFFKKNKKEEGKIVFLKKIKLTIKFKHRGRAFRLITEREIEEEDPYTEIRPNNIPISPILEQINRGDRYQRMISRESNEHIYNDLERIEEEIPDVINPDENDYITPNRFENNNIKVLEDNNSRSDNDELKDDYMRVFENDNSGLKHKSIIIFQDNNKTIINISTIPKEIDHRITNVENSIKKIGLGTGTI